MEFNKRRLERFTERGIHQLEVTFSIKFTQKHHEVIREHVVYRLCEEYNVECSKPTEPARRLSRDINDSINIVAQNARELIDLTEEKR